MAGLHTKKTQIIVDCQLLQTSDRQRGMGFYLRSLLKSLAVDQTARRVSWVFVLNLRLQQLEAEDETLLHQLDGRRLYVGLLHQGDCQLFAQAAAKNRQLIDKAIAPAVADETYEKTVYFIPAQFSREIYPVFPTQGTANLMLFHDLIPFLYHEQYFRDHEGMPRKDYAQRFTEVYRTDLFVTNSQTTADDLTIYLGVDPSRIVPILGAAADRKAASSKRPAFADELKQGYIFMPGGDDFRKNNALAARAFAELHVPERLVVTSSFGAESRRVLHDLCPNIMFAGPVPDDEFLWLLDHARAVFFPALYEGLGMPVLEAVERGIPVACSNIPVFAEISQDAFYYFDPLSSSDTVRALAEAMHALSDSAVPGWNAKHKQYPDILKRFTWPHTTTLFLEAVSQCELAPAKSRLAIFCPSPSSYSSVGKYAFEVHAEMSRLYDIDYFIEQGQTGFQPTRPNILEYAAQYYPAGAFRAEEANKYDRVLYHIGNSEFHVDTILNSLRLPAAAIIHDTRLNGIFDYMQARGFIPQPRREVEAQLDKAFHAKRSSCLASIATNQRILLTHSAYGEQAVHEVVKGKTPKVHRVPHPIGVPAIELRRSSDVVVSFAGIISEDKGIHLVADITKLDGVKVRVFGFGVLGDSPLLQGLENVEIMHDLTDKAFQDAVRTSDIMINYRPNYHGETSRSTLEAMRFGTVVIVKSIGWYDELPDDTVVKVANEAQVLLAVRRLIEAPNERLDTARAARKYLAKEYSFGRYAQLVRKDLEK